MGQKRIITVFITKSVRRPGLPLSYSHLQFTKLLFIVFFFCPSTVLLFVCIPPSAACFCPAHWFRPGPTQALRQAKSARREPTIVLEDKTLRSPSALKRAMSPRTRSLYDALTTGSSV